MIALCEVIIYTRKYDSALLVRLFDLTEESTVEFLIICTKKLVTSNFGFDLQLLAYIYIFLRWASKSLHKDAKTS